MRTKHALTSADVKKIIAACEAEAAKNNWSVAISVLDDSGILLGFHRMDGAPRISGEVSIGKARTSAMTGRPSKFFEDLVKARPAFVDFPGTLIQGGVPLMHDKRMRRRHRRVRRAVARGRADRASRGAGVGIINPASSRETPARASARAAKTGTPPQTTDRSLGATS